MNIPRFYNKSVSYFANITCLCSDVWKVENSLEKKIKLPSSSAPLLVTYRLPPPVSSVQTHTHSRCTFGQGDTPGLAISETRDGPISAISHESTYCFNLLGSLLHHLLIFSRSLPWVSIQ